MAAWLSLVIVATFQIVQMYNLETLSDHSNRAARYRQRHHFAPPQGAVREKEISEPRETGLGAPITQEQDGDTTTHHYDTANNLSDEQQEGFIWNTSSCQVWPRQNHATPKGLVVTLLLKPDDPYYAHALQRMLCRSIPSQLVHLVGPHQWDMLFLIAGEKYHKDLNFEHISACLNLTLAKQDPIKVWQNLDGSNLTTTEYRWDNRVSIFLSQLHLKWPQYVQDDLSILEKKIEPDQCNSPKSYIQGTRWYSNEMLHLAILQRYHWFIKMDVDLFFVKTIEWNLLHDLQTRNSLFSHTAALTSTGNVCADNIVHAVQEFVQASNDTHQHCDADNPALQHDRDHFYSNFIMGRVDFWTQPRIRRFSRFLSEFPEGFFHYRWTDQIFWAQALGLFVHVDDNTVVDYAELRCSVEQNCWRAVFNVKIYGDDSFNRCDNDAYFLHTKNYKFKWNRTVSHTGALWQSDAEVHPLSYKDECKERIARKRKEVNDKAKEAKKALSKPNQKPK